MRRFLSLFSLLALLLALAGNVAAQTPAQGPATALVYVSLTSHEDLARFEETGLPAYARMTGREEEYLLIGATPEEMSALSRAGLSFRILDPDMTGATYYFAYVMPGRPTPRWENYGRFLLDDGFQVLLRTPPAQAERLVREGVEIQALFLDPKPLRPWAAEDVIPAVINPDPLIQTMIDQVTTATVRTYNRQLAGELPVWVDGEWYTIPTRYTYSGTPIQKTTRWAGQCFAGLGLDVEYHQWGGSTYPNVIGEYTGLINPDDIFIICAHVDDVQGTPGADDNGSGSTAVLIAADILTQYRWGCTLRFALWTGEEQGLLGSYAYAQRSRNINENILDVVNLDMIAWNTPGSNPDIDLYARTSIPRSVALAQLFADVIDAYDLDLVPQILTSGGSGSDNSSFWQFNYSAILGIEDNNDFNPYYHGTGDTPAHTDLLYFTEFVKAALATFAHASGCLIPSGLGAVDGYVTDSTSGAPISGATVRARDSSGHVFPATTDRTGYYTRTLLAGTYTLTASHPQYESAVATGVVVFTDTVTTVDFALRPRGRLWGYVSDYDNGFPLAATLTSDDGLSAQSDPATGYYELYLDEGFHIVTATAENYFPAVAGVNLVSGQSTRQDFHPRAQVSFIPKPVHVTLLLNTTDSTTAQVLNRRASPYPFTTYEIAGGFIPGLEALWPGPDGFGYTGEAVDFNWIELRGSGTPIPGLTDDSYAGPFNIGFPFPFYGSDQTQFYVSSNGFLSFGGGSNDYTNDCPLPNSATPNNIIAPMWDDLYPNYTIGGVYYQTFNPCPIGSGRCLVVEYDHWAHCCDPNNIAGTFEAVLFENGSVLMQFLDGGSEEGSGSTTAVEGNNAPGNHGLTYACNSVGSIPDNLSICYVYPGSSGCIASNVPWLGESPTAGTVPAGGSLDLTLFFSATASAGITRTGDYYATLVVNGSPKIRVPVTMTVLSQPFPPTASFTSNTPVCLGEEAVFTDTSNPGFPPADAFLWDFGDGVTSTVRNPTHLYAQAGTYSVTFRLCNVAGCDQAEDVFVVEGRPEAGFTYSVSLLTAVFTNTSRNATAYLWDFGDGVTSTVEHPTHTYAAPGLYTVTLTAQGCGSDVHRAALTLTIPPRASFTSNTPVCLGEEAVFTDTSDPGFPPADTFLWDFGDGITSTVEHPTHTYAAAGTYSVTFRLCNAVGCDEAGDAFIVEAAPQAGFTYSVSLLTAVFTNTSQNATSYLWNFGDGVTSTLEHPTHTYAAAGLYTVTLTASQGCGSDIHRAALTLTIPPRASFTSNTPVCLGEEAVFTDTSDPGFPPADTFLWDFGDGITSTLRNPTHLYAAAGAYTVTFRLCNVAGCDQAEDVFVVEGRPEAGFTYSVSLLTAVFTNTSRNATAYLWDFGDRVTSTVEHPTHTYAAPGLYTVTLTAAGRCGEDMMAMPLRVEAEQPLWRIYLPLVLGGWSAR